MLNYKTTLKSNKGITLIALVITIIVMLILVSVILSLSINGGLFSKTKEAVEEQKSAIEYEQRLGEDIPWDELTGITPSGANGTDATTNVKNTQNITINKNSLEDTKTQQLSLSENMTNGGTWQSKDSTIVTVDDNGNATWQSIGKTKIIYKDTNNFEEVFNITCTYSIAASVQGWEVIDDCGQYGNSVKYNDQYSILNVLHTDDYTYAAASGNKNNYHVTIYRSIDLTNVKSIKFKGWTWYNEPGGTVANGYQSVIVKDNYISADCVFDSNYYTVRDMEQDNTHITFDVEYDVSLLTGSHLFAFTSTHGNCHQYSFNAGYEGEILLEP